MTLFLLTIGCVLAGAFAISVGFRLARTTGGSRIRAVDQRSQSRVSVIVPVLNERERLGPCLEGLIQQPGEVIEILIVDGGSVDGTQELVRAYAHRDRRVRLVSSSPVPRTCAGKAWGLDVALRASATDADFVLCMDADVRPAALLTRALLAHVDAAGVAALSVAVRQRLGGLADGLVHPAMLTTLVYRFGIPGRAAATAPAVQANGQCFLARRDVLLCVAPFRAARASLCEDITIARALATAGYAVGFYESDDLVEAAMYDGWRETWRNWPRSLCMRDQYFGWRGTWGLAEIAFAQALPLPLLCLAAWTAAPWWLIATAAALVAMRAGVLVGMARAYAPRPWTYWLSPLLDVLVTYAILRSALRRRHAWRGRTYIRVARGRFQNASETP